MSFIKSSSVSHLVPLLLEIQFGAAIVQETRPNLTASISFWCPFCSSSHLLRPRNNPMKRSHKGCQHQTFPDRRSKQIGPGLTGPTLKGLWWSNMIQMPSHINRRVHRVAKPHQNPPDHKNTPTSSQQFHCESITTGSSTSLRSWAKQQQELPQDDGSEDPPAIQPKAYRDAARQRLCMLNWSGYEAGTQDAEIEINRDINTWRYETY